MEQRVARYGLSMPHPPDAGMEDNGFGYFTHSQPPAEDSTLSLVSWDVGGRESMESFHQTLVSMGWPHQIPPATPSPLDVTGTASPGMAGHQYLPPSTEWLQPTSFGGGHIRSDSFDSGWSRLDSASWDPDAFAASTDAQAADDGSTPQQDEGPGYPLTPLKPESTTTFLPINWQHGEPSSVPEHQPFLASQYNLGHDRKRGAQASNGRDEGRKRKRGRLSIQSQDLGIDTPRYMPPPLLRRDSMPDTAYSLSRRESMPDLSYPLPRRDSMSDTTYSTSPPTSWTAQTFDTADAYHFSGGASDTTGTPPQPDDTTITTTGTATGPTLNPSRRRQQHQPSPSITTTLTLHPRKKPTIQARNRAAASRYRAKTQAAFAQLEAEEREASVRNQSLLACAGQLRDEVFQLKNELLRHADCDCPLIRGYLERAAERACMGLRG